MYQQAKFHVMLVILLSGVCILIDSKNPELLHLTLVFFSLLFQTQILVAPNLLGFYSSNNDGLLC